MCWLFHKWGKWELTNATDSYNRPIQRRTCERCNRLYFKPVAWSNF